MSNDNEKTGGQVALWGRSKRDDAYIIGRNHAANYHTQYKGATQTEFDAYRDEMAKRTFKGATSRQNYVEGFNEQVRQHQYVVSEEARRQFIDDTVDDAHYNAYLDHIDTPMADEY